MSTIQPRPATPSVAISRDPASGAVMAEHPFSTDAELEALLSKTEQAFAGWKDTSLSQRADHLRAMAAVLRAHRHELARLATAEMGKTERESLAEVEKCAVLCEWYAEHGPGWLADEPTLVPDGKAYVAFRPLGVVLAVMPWNFPYWQIMRAAVPILLGGNGYLVKPAENVVGCALLLHQLWLEAGLPEHVFAAVNLQREHVSKAIADPRIAAVTVTGSVQAGRSIAAQAGQALKKVLLELGGSDPFIVLADADLEAAATAAVSARFQNAGQVCIASKRLIVDRRVIDRFSALLLEKVQALKVGNGRDPAVQMGPMARLDLLEQLHRQVQDSVAAGARLLTGGQRLPHDGFFYAPTVLADVVPGMPVFDGETFGPVAALIEARDTGHAIELANQSDYGLSGALWTADTAEAKQLAAQLVTGAVFINGTSTSDPRVPIGGVKHSGFGRELSHFGLREFVNAQTVWLDRR
ncbi:NAD-dependent succinate-semialdehyde dehydrogenase [Frateuria aurantia]